MKTKLRRFLVLIFLCPWILANTECNTFSGTANKTSSAALFFQARTQINSGDYTGALTTLSGLSSTDLAGHDGTVLRATAYAGRCGLNLVSMGSAIANGITSKTVMQILLADMVGATSYTDCNSAETLMLGIAAASMTSDDYIFLAFVEFAKIGAALSTVADTDHNGAVDTGFNACNMAAGVTGDIGVALNVAFKALTSSGVTILSSSITKEWTTICSGTGALTYDCTNTSSSGFTTSELYVLRTLIIANEVGLNTCGGSSYSSLACTCL